MSEDFDLKLKRQEAGIIDKKTGQANAPYTKLAEATKKAAKATRYGKIALGVVAAGVAAKQFLKSKMSDDKKEEPKNTNASVKAKRLKELEGELNIDSKRGGGMIIAKGNKLARSKPTKMY
jgi:hypothetical protein